MTACGAHQDTPVVASKWSEHMDDEGREYRLERLSGTNRRALSKDHDDEGRECYYNETSGETSWDMQPEFKASTSR